MIRTFIRRNRLAASIIAAACGLLAQAAASFVETAEAQKTMTAPSSSAKALPAGALRVDLVEIMDRNGFEKPMVAARALVPQGWKTQGGVQWNSGPVGCVEPALFNWAAVSADGLSRVEMFPTEIWTASNSVQVTCQWGEFQDMRSYLTGYIQRRYPGAQVKDYRPRRDFLDVQQPWLDLRLSIANDPRLGMKAWADAGELTYSHRENGVEIDGYVSASAMFHTNAVPNPMGGPPFMTLAASTTSTFAARAPKGKLDLKIAEAIRKSIKPDAEWAGKMMAFKTRMGGIAAQATADAAAIIVANGAAMTAQNIAANNAAGDRARAAIRNNYADAYDATVAAGASSSATSDRMQRERIEGIRGVETYVDPVYGGTVQLDATYDHAWRVTNSDSYILTNDPSFNPGLYNIEAMQLQPVK